MQHLKTPKPATARHGEPVSKSEQLGGRLDPSNSPNAAGPQAPDISGENDALFFARRPGAHQRLRLPFPAELPTEVWQTAAAAGLAGFVIVTRGPPGARSSRKFVFAPGGCA